MFQMTRPLALVLQDVNHTGN